MTPEIVREIAEFTQCSQTLSKRALDMLAQYDSDREKAAAASPAFVDWMLANGIIDGQYKQATANMLGTHSGSLRLLKMAMDRNEAQRKLIDEQHAKLQKYARDLGVPEKEASDGAVKQASDPYTDRKTGGIKESDRAFCRALGMPVPA